MTNLPEEFLIRMKQMLGEAFPAFLKSCEESRHQGLRCNTLKIKPETLAALLPFSVNPVPWTDNGFYYPDEERPARHPFYACGLYYLQEPSAMTPASCLPVEPGDSVLDLCAAPGGKATELGAKLNGEGILVANDISNSRAKALLRNIELFGITNAFVTNENPARLAECFPEYFNKILVDAPCSGEGMFRKEPAVAQAWTPQKPQQCAAMQREIVSRAVQMLMPGGLLLYSTCTFAPVENEGTVSFILEEFPEMDLVDLSLHESFDHGNPMWGSGDPRISRTVRIWPHHSLGEGHFLALFQKKGQTVQPHRSCVGKLKKEEKKLMEEFFCDFTCEIPWNRMEVRAGKAYLLPPLDVPVRGIKFLRNGLYLGDLKKNRFEPSQQLALALRTGDYPYCISLSPADERVKRYLRGETIVIDERETARTKGWQLLCVEGYPLGWGKLVNGILKNKYPAGWRLL